MELPDLERAWSGRAGDVIFLQLAVGVSPERIALLQEQLGEVGKRLRIEFVLLDRDLSIVSAHPAEAFQPEVKDQIVDVPTYGS